ncbi:MAG: hypothetical protein CL529_12080 [Aequorivita sp.]|nr:hypothetical protein [Aequorivita sp.]|tara:strand:+ start:5672 stop:7750 length:2079 start_codon:yes stop_codon:yes gene_type:complete
MDKTKKGPSAIEVRDAVKKDVEKYYNQRKKNWKDEEELYFGKCWKNSNEYRPYENHVFPLIETAVPILTDNLPAPSVSVVDPSRIQHAKNLEKAINWVNEDQGLELLFPEVVRLALTTGNGYIHPYYDFDAKGGEGQEIYEVLKYNRVKLSGRSSKIEDCDKARIELDRSRDWLKLRYPEKEEELETAKPPESKDSDDSDRGKETQDYGSGYSRRTVPEEYCDDDTLRLVCTYKKDFSTEEIPEEDILRELEEETQEIVEGVAPNLNKWQNHKRHIEAHNDAINMLLENLGIAPNTPFEQVYGAVEQLVMQNPEGAEQFEAELQKIKVMFDHIEEHSMYAKLNPKGKRLKYKGGYRCIETVNDIVCYDGPNKNWHEQIPLVPFYCYRNGTIYADGMIRNIADSQRMQAVLGYKEYKGLQKVSNPEKEVNLESGLTKDDVTNEDGAIYETKSGTAWTVRNLPTGQVSEQGRRFQEDRKNTMDDISGMTDPTRGELPDGRLSEVTVTKTQNQALGRIRLKDRQNQYYSLRRLSKLVASDIIQHWTTEKVLELEDEGANVSQIIFNPLEMQNLEYDIKSTAGTMSGVDKDAFNGFASQLLNAQKITFTQFAEIVDMPKAEKLREFAKANDQMGAQAEQVNAEMEKLQIDNMKLKSEISTDLLSPEELKILEEVGRQEANDEITAVNNDQAEVPEL